MNDTLAPLMEIIDRVGYKSSQAGLLIYQDYVIWKGVETYIDIQRIRAGLRWNVRVVPFNPSKITDPQKNDTKHMESSPERIIDELKPTKHNRNKYQQNTTFRNDLWVKVKNSMKENTWKSTLDTNEPNPYKPLEEEVLEDMDK